MKVSAELVRVFFAYAYNRGGSGTIVQDSLRAACSLAARKMRRAFGPVEFRIKDRLVEYGEPLLAELHAELRGTDVLVADLGEATPNVFYELGYAHGLDCPAIVLGGAQSGGGNVASDLSNILSLDYEDALSLKTFLADRLVSVVSGVLKVRRSDPTLSASRLWLPNRQHGAPERISIVAASSDSPSPYRLANAKNHVYVDNLTDRDAILDLVATLCRIYPSVEYSLHCSEDVPKEVYERDLLLVGGTGSPEAENNQVAKTFVERLGIDVTYPSEDSLEHNGTRYQARHTGDGLVEDYGLYLRAPNPFDPRRMVHMIQGITTLGVLGVANALRPRGMATDLYRDLLAMAGSAYGLAAVFRVQVFTGNVVLPTLVELQGWS